MFSNLQGMLLAILVYNNSSRLTLNLQYISNHCVLLTFVIFLGLVVPVSSISFLTYVLGEFNQPALQCCFCLSMATLIGDLKVKDSALFLFDLELHLIQLWSLQLQFWPLTAALIQKKKQWCTYMYLECSQSPSNTYVNELEAGGISTSSLHLSRLTSALMIGCLYTKPVL